MTTAIRVALALVGVAMAGYGVSLAFDLAPADRVSLVIWFIGLLIAHDAVLAPIYSVFGHAGARLLPSTIWAPVLLASAATLVLVALSLPVLAPRPADKRPLNATILDRPYGLGLGVVLAIIWVLAIVLAVRNHRSLDRSPERRAPAN